MSFNTLSITIPTATLRVVRIARRPRP